MLNAALIGCGEMGRAHAECLVKLDGITCYACCDLNPAIAEAFGQKYNARLVTSNPDDIFKNTDIDVVYITTHTNSHLSLSLAALQASKHLMIEKPLALTSAEALRIHQAAARSRKIVMVALKFRFYEMVRKAQQLIPRPNMVAVQIMDDPWPDNFWANDGQIGGGNVISQGVHGTDLLRFLAGAEPEFVFAAGGNYHQKAGVIDNLSATFTFENGASGNLVVGDTGQPPLLGKFCVQLFGPEGSIIIMERLTRLQFHARANSSTMLFTGVENGFMAENRALVQAVHGQIPVATSTWDGYMAQAMIDAAIRSLQSKSAESVS